MKIFTRSQIKELDAYTIEHEPVSSIDLMERASGVVAHWIYCNYGDAAQFLVFAGSGNNGGDGLAVARMLSDWGLSVSVYLFNISDHISADCATNRDRLVSGGRVKAFVEVVQEFDPPALDEGAVVIDALFGSGLKRPLSGGFASLVRYINGSGCRVVSIDMPSGLMTEDNSYNVPQNIIRATHTLTLQQPKLSLLFAENRVYAGDVVVLDIRLSAEGMSEIESQYALVERDDVAGMLLGRNPFSHKGSMGHALLVAGSWGMCGAAILAARACLRSGVGKVTVHTPERNCAIMQVSVPEAIVHLDPDERMFTESVDTEGIAALGIGPGIGTAEETATALITQLRRATCPVVADADALNILARRKAWLQQLPKGIIFTPHPAEFDRMQGHCADSYERLVKAIDLAEHLQGYVIVKGRYSALCTRERKVFFNTTGNAGMATAGSGDVLTGIITGLLARGYSREHACIAGMYLHGLAGDVAAEYKGMESLVASDIIDALPEAFCQIR